MRVLAWFVVVQMACYAPQQAGTARTVYTTMATTDGAFLGTIGGVFGCSLIVGENRGEKANKLVAGCALTGLVAGGAASLLGTLASEREPSTGTWIVVSTLPALLGAALVIGSVDWVVKKLR
jgi:hypothetical protein